jgi:hypothetical protein
MRSRSLLSNYSLKPYRVCPDCNGKYTTDRKTKTRHFLILVPVLLMFVLTHAAITDGLAWLFPAVASHIAFWVYLGYAISKMTYVCYRD